MSQKRVGEEAKVIVGRKFENNTLNMSNVVLADNLNSSILSQSQTA